MYKKHYNESKCLQSETLKIKYLVHYSCLENDLDLDLVSSRWTMSNYLELFLILKM